MWEAFQDSQYRICLSSPRTGWLAGWLVSWNFRRLGMKASASSVSGAGSPTTGGRGTLLRAAGLKENITDQTVIIRLQVTLRTWE